MVYGLIFFNVTDFSQHAKMVAESLHYIFSHQIIQVRLAKLLMALDQFPGSSARITCWLETLLLKAR